MSFKWVAALVVALEQDKKNPISSSVADLIIIITVYNGKESGNT